MSLLPPPLAHFKLLNEAENLNGGRMRDRSLPHTVRKGTTHTTEGERKKHDESANR